MKSVLVFALFLIFLCSCKREESEELGYAFFNGTPDTLNIVYYVKTSELSEPALPNSPSPVWYNPNTLDILEGINSYLDSISIKDYYSKIICKFTKTKTYNYRGNPFTDRDKWIYQGIKRITRRSERTIYVNVHEYWFKIESDSIIVH